MAGKGGKISPATEFKPGQSGNPKGRPRKLPQLNDLIDTVLGDEVNGLTAAEAILKKLRQLAVSGNLKAAEMLLDRAYGKPKQVTDITTDGQSISPLSTLPAEKQAEVLRILSNGDNDK
jgi:hypothetical protein